MAKFKLVQMDHATKRAFERTGKRDICDCLEPQYSNAPWRELGFHFDRQDTKCDGWKRLLEIIEAAAEDGREVFEPGADIPWDQWLRIVTLPSEIEKLTAVRELRLYGSNLVRLPPEIGRMSELRVLDLYTSYRLHWLPYEVTRCAKLEDSRISTRALYGNFKYRPPFPRLRPAFDDFAPETCSVCDQPFAGRHPRQFWISLDIATDVVPLLVHACSSECVESLPVPPKNYVEGPHEGGTGVAQPAARY